MVGLQLLDVSKLRGTNSNNHQRLHQIDLVVLGKVDQVGLGKELVGTQLDLVVGKLVVGKLVVGKLVVELAGRQAHYFEQFEAQVLELALQLGQLGLR